MNVTIWNSVKHITRNTTWSTYVVNISKEHGDLNPQLWVDWWLVINAIIFEGNETVDLNLQIATNTDVTTQFNVISLSYWTEIIYLIPYYKFICFIYISMTFTHVQMLIFILSSWKLS